MIGLLCDFLTFVFLMVGAGFAVLGAIGINRMPDVYTRLHAAGMTDTMGASFILIGLMFQSGLTLISVKLFLVMAFLLFTSPMSSHAVAAAALRGGLRPKLHPNEEQSP